MECHLCCDYADIHAKYPCKHTVCCRCAVKMLFLYGEKKCPFCKKDEGKAVFFECNNLVSKRAEKKHKEDSVASYESERAYKAVKDMLGSRCKACKWVCKSKGDLSAHYKKEHSLLICPVCLENNHQLWDEIETYEFDKIGLHRKGMLNEPGFGGHCFCIHCNKYFFNKDVLKRHCHMSHYLCTLCEVLGKRLQFYKDYSNLEKHYKASHYCCTDEGCFRNHCYVFANKSELWEHLMGQHSVETQLSDIDCGSGLNPPVVSLMEESTLSSSIYRETERVATGPFVKNTSYFPPMYRSSNNSSSAIPEYMNRSIIQSQVSAALSRLKQVSMITKSFAPEITQGIERYITGCETLDTLVKDIENAVGNRVCLRILETISFSGRQPEVSAFLGPYKKSILFPPFRKQENSQKPQSKPQKKKSIGFKIIDASFKR